MSLRAAVQARLRSDGLSTVDPSVLAAMGLADFSRSDLVVRVESSVLGESVLFAGARAKVPPKTEFVVYRGEELEVVQRLDSDGLRVVHQVKKLFNGRIFQGDPHG